MNTYHQLDLVAADFIARHGGDVIAFVIGLVLMWLVDRMLSRVGR